MYRRAQPAALAVLATLFLTDPAFAQTAVFPTLEPSQWARVEAGRPDASGTTSPGGFSSVWFLTASTPIPGGVVLVGELPLAYLDGQGGHSTAAMGNPYVGARMQFDTGPLTEFEIGIRLPLAGEHNEAMGIGFWADLADRPEAFFHRAVPLTLRAVRTMELGGGAAIDLAAGSVWWLMSGPEHTEQVIFATYSGQARTALGPIHFTAGASGRYAALGEPIEALAGATHQVSGSIDYGHPRIRPGFFITQPLTEPAASHVGATMGLRILVPFGD